MLNHKSEFGLTIIEALIAVLIFSMIASSLLLINRQSASITNDSKMRNIAINLARERIESLKYLDRNDSVNILTRNSSTWKAINGFSENRNINGVNFIITTTLENTNNSSPLFQNSSIVPLRVTVQWDNNGATGQVFFDTCFTQY
jgi:Tfp pilus assembly protein PilV